MKQPANELMETPIYGLSEAAQYLRVPLNTLRYWVQGGRSASPLIKLKARTGAAVVCESAGVPHAQQPASNL